MEKLYFFREYLEERYGKTLQRISFDLGLSCPNRKKDGSGGCAFCSGDGARARHLTGNMSLKAQFDRSAEYLRERYGTHGPYIAYFQAYTSTFGELSQLKKLYEEALSYGDFPVVVISTRPDCLPEDILDYLEELAQKYELWIELGVQTAKDATLEKINRGHDFACAKDAIERIARRKNIKCAPHVILGLPGETREDFLETARQLALLPIAGIKVHNLLTLRGTPMAKMLHDGEVVPMNEFTYADHLSAFLRILPEKTVLLRLSAEEAPEKVIAPSWWMSKGAFLEMFRSSFANGAEKSSLFQAVRTQDGSYTYYHPQYKQYFHSIAGAFSESWKKYLEVCSIPELYASGRELRILEVGFGLGCNASALAALGEREGKGKIFLQSLELDEKVLESALALPEHPQKEMLTSLREKKAYQKKNFSMELAITDAREYLRETLAQTSPAPQFDFIFLDGFSPDSNAELWSIDLVDALRRLLLPGGIVATYCHAYPLIGAFFKAGFTLYESNPYGRKKGGLAAVNGVLPEKESYPLLTPLPSKEEKIALLSTAGIPYEDPGLSNTRETILAARKALVEQKRKEGMPKWYKEK